MDRIIQNPKVINTIMVVFLLISLGLFFMQLEAGRDMFVNLLTLIALLIAFYFNYRVTQENGAGWLVFSISFILLCSMIFFGRLWDYLAILKDYTKPENIDPNVIKMYAKIGERIAFVLLGVFSLITVKELYSKLMKELGLL